MTFVPPKGTWSRDDLSTADGAVYLNSGEYEITSGVARLLPRHFSGLTYSFDVPWAPVTGWTFTNTLDTIILAERNFSIISTTGLASTVSGTYGNSGDFFQSAFFTHTPSPILDDVGVWVSGAHSCLVHNAGHVGGQFTNHTIEFSARSLTTDVNHILGPEPSSGVSCHGLYIGDTTHVGFIEVHPSGLKVHGTSGAVLPGDFYSSMRRVRVARAGTALTIMTDDGGSLYVPSGMRAWPTGQLSTYVAFGAPPFQSGANFTGAISGFHSGSYFTYDPRGLTGIAGFEGTVLWDDVKVLWNTAAVAYPTGYPILWPQGQKTIYTAPWYPSNNISNYLGAVIDVRQFNGGTTTVSVEYLIPSGTSGLYNWTGSSQISSVVFNGTQGTAGYLDMGAVPVFPGINNAVRFKLVAESLSGAVPEVDTITAIAKNNYSLVDITPNWKLSALPKDIFFVVNKDNHKALIPPPHYQDEIYLHNESGQASVAVSSYVGSPEPYLGSGQVLSSYTGQGLVRVEDGYYGDAWRNFNLVTGYSGTWMSSTYSILQSGSLLHEGNIFYGELLDNFVPHPGTSSVPSVATGMASVHYSVDPYVNWNGQTILAQKCTVDSWVHATNKQDLGFQLSGMVAPAGQIVFGVVQGVIQISRGPGVLVTMNDGDGLPQKYYLDGNLYREPQPFSCAAIYTGNRSNQVSFGVLPRTTKPADLDLQKWGGWTSEMESHEIDEFTLFALTGYTTDHSFIKYTTTGAIKRVGAPLTGNSIYNTIPYKPIDRSSVLFEGWIRPHGIITNTSGEVELMKSVSLDDRGVKLFINRSGEIRAMLDLNVHSSALGQTGDVWYPVGPRLNGTLVTGTSGSVLIPSLGNALAWGSWNHVGIYQDVRALGDLYTAANQPLLATGSVPSHGARTAKAILEINGRPINSIDIGIDGYSDTGKVAGSVTSTFPTTGVYLNVWPKIPTYAMTGTSRITTMGQYVMCDFDHVRFGIRDSIDARVASNVFGYKDSPPWFNAYNGIRPPEPRSGLTDHYQWAHIWRLDHPTQYNGWDDGFSPNPLLFPNYQSSAADLTSRGIKAGYIFLRTETGGPKGRPYLRVGPGANVIAPFSTYDERLFNGTGSAPLSQSITTGYYAFTAQPHPDLMQWYSGISGFNRYSSDTRVAFGGFVKLFKYPTGDSTTVGDIFTLAEANGDSVYGVADLYLGVTTGGYLVAGTRKTRENNGWANDRVVGPFTGSKQLPLNQFVHIGLEAAMGYGTGFIQTRYTGALDINRSLHITAAGAPGAITGGAIGYQGVLGTSLSNAAFRSNFIMGGEHPKDTQLTNQQYRFMDVGLSEVFLAFPISGYGLPWAKLAHTGTSGFSGHCDAAVKNDDEVVGNVVGTGTIEQQPYYGVTTYPATDYEDAGSHLLYCASMGGKDYEGLNKVGLPLFDETVFTNAHSYYVVYENDSTAQIFGSTDSPIQIGPRVPPEGVNLALISNKEWNSESAISTFDMSDQNYANITNKLHGDFTIRDFVPINGLSGLAATGQITSSEVRVSSFPLWSYDSSNQYVGYFMHLIGGEDRGVYVVGAAPHIQVTGDYALYHNNLDKVQKAITIKDAQGEDIPYDEFPYRIITIPYAPSTVVADLSGHNEGYGATYYSGQANPDRIFTSILVANKQTIGKTVFIHYPSKGYVDGVINLQDSEIYNPVPLMKQIGYTDIYDISGQFIAGSGSYSLDMNNTMRSYDLKLWHANLTGWVA